MSFMEHQIQCGVLLIQYSLRLLQTFGRCSLCWRTAEQNKTDENNTRHWGWKYIHWTFSGRKVNKYIYIFLKKHLWVHHEFSSARTAERLGKGGSISLSLFLSLLFFFPHLPVSLSSLILFLHLPWTSLLLGIAKMISCQQSAPGQISFELVRADLSHDGQSLGWPRAVRWQVRPALRLA